MITIIYHGDQDGFMSAYLIMESLNDKSIKLMEMQYGDQFPNPEVFNNKIVFLVDFTFSQDYMEQLAEKAHKLIVVDHHESARNKVNYLANCFNTLVILDTSGNKSACGLVLKYINLIINFAGYETEHVDNIEQLELLTKYIEDADLFKHKLLNWQEITSYIQTVSLELESYDQLVEKLYNDFEGVVELGKVLVRSMNLQREKVVKSNTRYLSTMSGEVAVTNVPAYLPSAVGNYVVHSKTLNRKIVYAVDWWVSGNGKMILSFRSKKADVRKIAESLGGGGHPRASGAEIDLQSDYAKWIMGV